MGSMKEVAVNAVPEGAQLVDVREDFEYAEDHAAGTIHIPMQEIPARADELDGTKEIYVICKGGGRSAQVCQYLEQSRGWDVINVEGGTDAWRAAGLPMER